MQRKAAASLKIQKKDAQKVLIIAKLIKLVDKELNVQKDNDYVYIPLAKKPTADELTTLKKEANLVVSTRQFYKRKRKTSVYEVLESELPPHLLSNLPHAADFVGTIAIIDIPTELKPYEMKIGSAILRVNKNVRTVLAKTSAVGGTYRLRKYTTIAGEDSTETIHRENECSFMVDVTKAYFSPRLSHEHRRIASLVRDRETVVDLFTGVGPFAVLIAKTNENAKVYAVDANPDAVEYLKINIRLNRVTNRVLPVLGDAKQIADKRLACVADRVIMNLPERAIEFVDAACRLLKPDGGVIHFYSFVNASSPPQASKLAFKEAVERSGRRIDKFLSSRKVRATAPYEWQTCLDVRIL